MRLWWYSVKPYKHRNNIHIINLTNWLEDKKASNFEIQNHSPNSFWCSLEILHFPCILRLLIGLPRWQSDKESACQCKWLKRPGFDPWVGKIPWRRKWQPTPVFLPGQAKFHGQRSLAGYSPWGSRVSHNWVCKQVSICLHSRHVIRIASHQRKEEIIWGQKLYHLMKWEIFLTSQSGHTQSYDTEHI